MTADELAQALRRAVLDQRFEATPDRARGGAAVGAHPSIDLAVAAFPAGGEPVCANVLFSREHPQGLVAQFDGPAGAVANIRFESDLRDARGESPLWQPGADWAALQPPHWFGQGAARFIAPYPASLVKLMVLVGVARLVDQGRTAWHEAVAHDGRSRAVADWAMDMTAISCNTATDALVAHLHACGAIEQHGGTEVRNELHEAFARHGLPGLRLAGTTPRGGWRNADGAGVGQLQMTAWDALRLAWLIDPDAPPPPWLPAGTPRLLAGSAAHVRHCLGEQALHEILSSAALAALPGWQAGIPARLPTGWLDRLDATHAAELGGHPADAARQARSGAGEVRFAHKTGTTDNYASDAGWLRGVAPFKRHYLIAVTTTLGRRFAAHPAAATTWRLPALGAAVDALLKPWLER